MYIAHKQMLLSEVQCATINSISSTFHEQFAVYSCHSNSMHIVFYTLLFMRRINLNKTAGNELVPLRTSTLCPKLLSSSIDFPARTISFNIVCRKLGLQSTCLPPLPAAVGCPSCNVESISKIFWKHCIRAHFEGEHVGTQLAVLTSLQNPWERRFKGRVL